MNEEEKVLSTDISKDKPFIFVNSKMLFFGLYYVLILIITLYLGRTDTGLVLNMNTGDGLIPVLLSILSNVGFKWCPIFCVIGLILNFVPRGFNEIKKIYMISVTFLAVMSLLLLLFV